MVEVGFSQCLFFSGAAPLLFSHAGGVFSDSMLDTSSVLCALFLLNGDSQLTKRKLAAKRTKKLILRLMMNAAPNLELTYQLNNIIRCPFSNACP